MIQQNFVLPKGTQNYSEGQTGDCRALYNMKDNYWKKDAFSFRNVMFQQISGVLWDPQNWFENSENIPTQFNTI